MLGVVRWTGALAEGVKYRVLACDTCDRSGVVPNADGEVVRIEEWRNQAPTRPTAFISSPAYIAALCLWWMPWWVEVWRG